MAKVKFLVSTILVLDLFEVKSSNPLLTLETLNSSYGSVKMTKLTFRSWGMSQCEIFQNQMKKNWTSSFITINKTWCKPRNTFIVEKMSNKFSSYHVLGYLTSINHLSFELPCHLERSLISGATNTFSIREISLKQLVKKKLLNNNNIWKNMKIIVGINVDIERKTKEK